MDWACPLCQPSGVMRLTAREVRAGLTDDRWECDTCGYLSRDIHR